MSEIIDISPVITDQTNVWPGDTPFSRQVLCEIAKGATVTLTTIRTTVHLGAHADAPSHYAAGGAEIGARALRHYLGPCRVIDAPVARGSRVSVRDLRCGIDALQEERVLIRTGTFPSHEHWNNDFAGLEPALIDALADRGVITIGIDTPGVDLEDSKELPAHKTFARRDMAILEGLVLTNVTPGVYELIALPLRLMGVDASPVRAVLRRY